MGNPGKFEACYDQELAEKLYDMTMDNSQNDELGDVNEYGVWQGLIINPFGDERSFIVEEDEQGFFYVNEFDTIAEAAQEWKICERKYAEWAEGVDGE